MSEEHKKNVTSWVKSIDILNVAKRDMGITFLR